jgi:twitching motility protein PilT
MPFDLDSLLREAVEADASDIFVISGLPVSFKIDGKILPRGTDKVNPASAREIISGIYARAERDMAQLLISGDDDFSVSVSGLSRFRVCAYKQRGSLATVIRVVKFDIPDYRKLNIPDEVIAVARRYTKGLVLVTGPAGGGKSTTLACMIDEINRTRTGHIITLEDPIEFFHRNIGCVISQREIKNDTTDYVTALRASLRQSPDVILLGEMRDFETIKTAITAAETGHLVISTLHTVGAVNTVDRIIDVFPPAQQQQVRVQLAMILGSVISQQLIPTTDGSLVPAFEIMHANGAIRNMIRESKTHQIDSVIYSSAKEGMISMDAYIYELYKIGRISRENALRFAAAPDTLEKRIQL